MQLATDCNRCGLRQAATKVVWGSGNPNANIMFIGEAPGKLEDKAGYPFVESAPAGKEFDLLLSVNGFARSDVYITNCVKCHPVDVKGKDREPSQSEMDTCQMWLAEEIRQVQPKFIITVGRTSTRLILGDVDMEMDHGVPRTVDMRHWGLDHPTVIIPVYHPAAGLHRPDTMLQVQSDFATVRGVVSGQIPPSPKQDQYPRPDYRVTNGESDVAMDMAWAVAHGGLIAVDTEWARQQPWCLTYSIRPGMARLIWANQSSALNRFTQHVSSPHNITIIHNALYDLPVLEQMGVEVARPSDTMVMAYLLQSEPQGLKTLAYRHLGMTMTEYSDMVKSATHRHAIIYLTECIRALDSGKVVDWRMMKRVTRILSDYARKPDETDIRKRWLAIDKEDGRLNVEAVLGKMQEGELCDIDEEDAVRYACRDADATMRLYPLLWARVCDSGMGGGGGQ